MVPAKAFSPAPKVKSCLVKLEIKNSKCEIRWNSLIEFLDLYSGFSRKTLSSIEKILIKQNKKILKISEDLNKKRMEELNREDLEKILNL
jgi:16S rRNA A1518/A1519 N6-dimethyltransferase RsmA/KsgA/DIM1 with predicted DNA glycosylase/AP lyase activity